MEKLLTEYTDKHPAVIKLQEQIERLKSRIETEVREAASGKADLLESELAALRGRARFVKEMMEKYRDDLDYFPEISLEYGSLRLDFELHKELHSLFRKRLSDMSIAEAQEMASVAPLDRAMTPTSVLAGRRKAITAVGAYKMRHRSRQTL